MKKVVAAVIGCGYISKFHFEGLVEAGAEIRYVSDLDAGRAEAQAALYKASVATPEAIYADRAVDVVVVAALPTAHRELCLAAIAAGKAVVCEKTLGMNLDEAREITMAAKQGGKPFYTSFMKRFFPASQKAKELLPSLGELISAHVRTWQPWGDMWTMEPDAEFFGCEGMSYGKWALGGGMLTLGGSHLLDMTVYLLGRPQRVYSVCSPHRKLDVDLRTESLFETAEIPIHFEAVGHPLPQLGPRCDGWEERIEITGVDGRLELYFTKWDNFMNQVPWLVHFDSRTGTTTRYDFPAVSPFTEAVKFFCSQIAAGKQGDYSIFAGHDVDCLIDAQRVSGSTRQPVDIVWPR